MKHKFEPSKIHIDQFYNVVESMHLSWLFQSTITLPMIRQEKNLFIFRSLGLLNCIRIWHDNSSHGGSASWFLKYLIIRDLQTMEKFHFISQQWFAVEKDDGKVRRHFHIFDSSPLIQIERVLPVAGEIEKGEFSYILSKQTYQTISDSHLWFSIFSRPASNQFTRVQRCTCCFVLFFISMFLNIMYYDLSNETKMANSTVKAGLSLGPIYLSSQQIVVGIVVELFALIPSLLIVQLFRRIHSRRARISPLKAALSKIRSTAALYVITPEYEPN